jgi:hypothetical protein
VSLRTPRPRVVPLLAALWLGLWAPMRTLATGAEPVGIDGGLRKPSAGSGRAMAAEPTAVRTISPPTIRSVSVDLPAELHARSGVVPMLRVTAGAAVLDDIEVTAAADGEVTIRARRSFSSRQGIRVDIVSDRLVRIEAAAAGSVEARDMHGPGFDLKLGGAVDASLTGLKVGQLSVESRGAGSITVQGSARTQRLALDGSGNYDGGGLDSLSTSIRLGGSGDVRVAASRELDVIISGAGTVKYRGEPLIRQRIAGAGAIEHVAD